MGDRSDASGQGGRASGPGAGLAPELAFEDSARRLAEIVLELEGGELPLERSLELFEEGVRLARAAQRRLDEAERRVEELLGIDANGKPVTRDFDAGPVQSQRGG